MTAFWLTWKPSGWPLEKLQALVRRVRADPEATEPWRIQAHTQAAIAARVFLFKQGEGARGIFGVGEIADLPRLMPEESKNPDAPRHFAPIRFLMLEDPTERLLLPLEDLTDVISPTMIAAQASGTTLPDKVAEVLESRIGLDPAKWKVSPRLLTDREAVLKTVAEVDELGRAAFLMKYGFGEARDYMLEHEGRAYDSKAIVGVAFKHQDGFRRVFGPRAFSGGAETVQKALEHLGFQVLVNRLADADPPTNLSTIASDAADDTNFAPTSVEDARKRVLATIVARRGQRAFRQALIAAYGGRCAITGCDVLDVLEAAHITPYLGEQTNTVQNGLLLRADLHTLFDVGRLAVDPESLRVLVAPALEDPTYRALEGRALRTTSSPASAPNRTALRSHRDGCGF